jgi:Nineteen complex-related protein 2
VEKYIDDGGMALGESAQHEQNRRRREGIREAINEAEGIDDIDGDSNVSRDSLEEELERDQIRKGVVGSGITRELGDAISATTSCHAVTKP